jgi:hypothetical protein
MECPEDEGVDLMHDLPDRYLCPACGRGWRLNTTTGKLVEDTD